MDLPDDLANGKLFAYIVIGREKGKDGTPHLQGYCVMIKPRRLTAMKKIMPRAHLEVARGTPLEASDYCKKDGLFEEYGELPKTAGERSSEALQEVWDTAWENAKSGHIEAIPSWMRISYYAALKRIQKDYPVEVEDLPKTCGVWIYGKTGAGKSYKARKEYKPFYVKPCTKWWDGYQGQPNVIVDDFDASHVEELGHLLKIWADRYAFGAENKGGTLNIRPEKIIVTSQWPMTDLFAGKELAALSRRFEQVYQPAWNSAFRDYYVKIRRELEIPESLLNISGKLPSVGLSSQK